MSFKLPAFPVKAVMAAAFVLFAILAFHRSDRPLFSHSDAHSLGDDVIEHTFSVRPGGTLLMDTDRGSIQVETGKSDEVHVVIERISRGASDEEMDLLEFSFDESGDKVSVLGKYDGRRPRGKANKFNVKIRVQVPKEFDVDLKTSGGSVSVDDLVGQVDARTSGGSLSFGNINGPVNGKTSGGSISLESGSGDAVLRTSGGSISLGRIDGEVDAQTSGGSISIEEASGSVVARTSGGQISVKEVRGAIDASTSGGGITAYISEQPRADSRLSTGGGHVTVRLNPDIKLSVRAKSSGGSVSAKSLPISVEGKQTRTRLNGDLNGGGPLLELQTSGGGVTIKSTN